MAGLTCMGLMIAKALQHTCSRIRLLTLGSPRQRPPLQLWLGVACRRGGPGPRQPLVCACDQSLGPDARCQLPVPAAAQVGAGRCAGGVAALLARDGVHARRRCTASACSMCACVDSHCITPVFSHAAAARGTLCTACSARCWIQLRWRR